MRLRFGRGAAVVVATVLVAGSAQAAGSAGPSSAPLSTWQANGRVRAIAISKGVVYIGGSFTALMSHGSRRSVVRHGLAAIDEATGRPTSWNPNVNGRVDVLRVIGTRVYVGGSFTAIGGTGVHNVAAVRRGTGRVASGFRAGANGEVDALAASSSRLYVGGSFSRVNGRAHSNLAAVARTTGALVGAWTARTDGAVHALLASTTTGRVYVGGHFSRVDGVARPFLTAVGGKRGSVFRWASPPLGQVWALALSPQGPLYAAVGGHQGGQLDSYRPVTGLRRWHRFADGDVQAVAIAGYEILAGGHFLNACRGGGGGSPWMCGAPVQRDRFFATSTSGALEPWNPGANSLYGVWALRADAAHVDAGGDFTIVHGAHQARYAEFLR
jgi:hypothetical protein